MEFLSLSDSQTSTGRLAQVEDEMFALLTPSGELATMCVFLGDDGSGRASILLSGTAFAPGKLTIPAP